MFVQAIGQSFAFIVAIVLAQQLTLSDYGQYVFGVTLATVLAVFLTLGADGMLARTWGWAGSNGYSRNKLTFFAHNWFCYHCIPVMIIILIVIFCFNYYVKANWIQVWCIAFALPFLLANFIQSFFIAIRKVIWANIIQLGLRIILLVITGLFILHVIQDFVWVVFFMWMTMCIYIVSIWTIMAFNYGNSSHRPIGNNISFMFLKWGNLLLVQADIFLLKYLSTNEGIAIYSVALQLSALVSFVLNAINSNVISQIASDYKHCSSKVFQRRITTYTRMIVSLSGVVIIALLGLGYFIVKLYGESYIYSYYLFTILMIGQTINVLCGSVATIMNMSGHEKYSCKVFYQALLINIILGSILFCFFNLYGVAFASSVAVIYWNIKLVLFVKRKLGINPTIFCY